MQNPILGTILKIQMCTNGMVIPQMGETIKGINILQIDPCRTKHIYDNVTIIPCMYTCAHKNYILLKGIYVDY